MQIITALRNPRNSALQTCTRCANSRWQDSGSSVPILCHSHKFTAARACRPPYLEVYIFLNVFLNTIHWETMRKTPVSLAPVPPTLSQNSWFYEPAARSTSYYAPEMVAILLYPWSKSAIRKSQKSLCARLSWEYCWGLIVFSCLRRKHIWQ